MVLIQKSGAGVVIITVMIIAFAATFADDYLQGCRAATEELENLVIPPNNKPPEGGLLFDFALIFISSFLLT